MRFLPTRVHGVVDYVWAVLLVASPYLFGFSGTAAAIAFAFGLAGAAYSVLTDYELGAVRLLPMPVHLSLDALAGGVLALLPLALSVRGAPAWVFGAFGTFAVVAAFVTRARPDDRRMA